MTIFPHHKWCKWWKCKANTLQHPGLVYSPYIILFTVYSILFAFNFDDMEEWEKFSYIEFTFDYYNIHLHLHICPLFIEGFSLIVTYVVERGLAFFQRQFSENLFSCLFHNSINYFVKKVYFVLWRQVTKCNITKQKDKSNYYLIS